MNILIVGGSGFLGRELAQQAGETGHAVTATFATRAGDVPGVHWVPMDLCRSEEITPVLRAAQPDGVVNAAYRKAGRRADTASPGALDVRLDSTRTQRTLRTHLRGARDFLRRER